MGENMGEQKTKLTHNVADVGASLYSTVRYSMAHHNTSNRIILH